MGVEHSPKDQMRQMQRSLKETGAQAWTPANKRTRASSSPGINLNNEDEEQPVTLSAIKELMEHLFDSKLKNMATKQDVYNITTKLGDIQKKNIELEEKVTTMEKRCANLEKQLENVMIKTNEKNIILHVTADNNRNAADIGKAVCLKALKTSDETIIEDIKVLRSSNNTKSNLNITLRSKIYADGIIKQHEELKKDGVSVHRDLPYAARERRKTLFNIMKTATQKNRNLIAKIKSDKLIVNEKVFYLSPQGGLMHNGAPGQTVLDELTKSAKANPVLGAGTNGATGQLDQDKLTKSTIANPAMSDVTDKSTVSTGTIKKYF